MKNIEGKFDEEKFKAINTLLKKIGEKILTKKQYLINERKSKKSMKKFSEEMKYCEENGHTSNGDGIVANGTKVYGTCSHCGRMYYRSLTSKEATNYGEKMSTPITI